LRQARSTKLLLVGTWHCCHAQPHTCSTLPVSPWLLSQNCHKLVLQQILAQTLLHALQAAQAQKVHWTSSGTCNTFKGRHHRTTANLNQVSLMLTLFSIGSLQAALQTTSCGTVPLTCSRFRSRLPSGSLLQSHMTSPHSFLAMANSKCDVIAERLQTCQKRQKEA
jgi:hypothetical protein